MKSIWSKRIATALTLATLSIATSAFAQYVWLDEKGVKQYSDMPPPSSVPQKRILKEGGVTPSAASNAGTESGSVSAADGASAKDKTPMTAAEKNADFQKRKAEQAEKEKKAADESKRAKDNAKNCEHARAYNQALESGERIAHTDKNGERAFLSDAQRTQEVRDTRRILSDCK